MLCRGSYCTALLRRVPAGSSNAILAPQPRHPCGGREASCGVSTPGSATGQPKLLQLSVPVSGTYLRTSVPPQNEDSCLIGLSGGSHGVTPRKRFLGARHTQRTQPEIAVLWLFLIHKPLLRPYDAPGTGLDLLGCQEEMMSPLMLEAYSMKAARQIH